MRVVFDVVVDPGHRKNNHGCRHRKVGNLLDFIVTKKSHIPKRVMHGIYVRLTLRVPPCLLDQSRHQFLPVKFLNKRVEEGYRFAAPRSNVETRVLP